MEGGVVIRPRHNPDRWFPSAPCEWDWLCVRHDCDSPWELQPRARTRNRGSTDCQSGVLIS